MSRGKAAEEAVKTFCRTVGLTCRRIGPGGQRAYKGGRTSWGTAQAPGLPDFVVSHRAKGIAFFVEVKTGTGRLSPSQKEFKADMDAAGWTVIVGDWQDVARHLAEIGYLT